MKTIIIGDLHGKTSWKNIKEVADQWIFLGDYFDCREKIPTYLQINNFKEICEFSRSEPGKVKILLGNHELMYLRGIQETYSGYQPAGHLDIQEVLEQAIKEGLISISEMDDQVLFSHAGITKTWSKLWGIDLNLTNISQQVNDLFLRNRQAFCFDQPVGFHLNSYGDNKEQGPLWVRPKSLLKDCSSRWIQVVGHTEVESIDISKDQLILADAMASGQYLILEDGKFTVKEVNT